MRKREGIEPRYGYETVGADMLSFIEGNIKGADETMAPANSLGSKTVARHQGRVGNSGGPMGSSREGRRAAQPDNREEAPTTHGKSDALVRATKWGNAPRAKGAQMAARSTATPPTRRGGPAATTGVERIATRARREPLTRYTALMYHFTLEQPTGMLRGAGRNEGAWSG